MFFKNFFKKKKVEPIRVDFDKFNLNFAKTLGLKYDPKPFKQESNIKLPDRNNILGNFSLELLYDYKLIKVSQSWIDECYRTINYTLSKYEVSAKVVSHNVGASVVRFDLSLGDKTKIAKIENIKRELANSLKIETITIDTTKFGIIIPLKEKSFVGLKNIFKNYAYFPNKSKLKVALGLDIDGNIIFMDLTILPHLLIAGSSGGGKSVCVNTLLTNLLFNYDTSYLRLILADLKKVELTPYKDIPHLLKPIITNVDDCVEALRYLQSVIEERQELFAKNSNKNIESYNEENEKLPYIVFLVDEFSKLIIDGKEVAESLIQDIAERGRAFGIHMILTTQTPNKNVITRTIKNNLLGRIAFKVDSREVSDMILGEKGAETLLGNGDMYFKHNTITRLQGAFIDEDETEAITNYLRSIKIEIVTNEKPKNKPNQLYYDIGKFFISQRRASVSSARKINDNFTKCKKIVNEMQINGVVSCNYIDNDSNKGFEVLMNLEEFEKHWRELNE